RTTRASAEGSTTTRPDSSRSSRSKSAARRKALDRPCARQARDASPENVIQNGDSPRFRPALWEPRGASRTMLRSGRFWFALVFAPVLLLLIAIESGKHRMVYAGPVLSHYEFEMAGVNRKSDSEWQADLREGRVPPRAEWTRTYLVPHGK